jgi:hypothetical protein
MEILSLENSKHVAANGSHYVGVVKTSFWELVDCFGNPTVEDQYDKTTKEWKLAFTIKNDKGEEDIKIATIYDWKEIETPYDDYEWHVGGFSHDALKLVEQVIEKYRI